MFGIMLLLMAHQIQAENLHSLYDTTLPNLVGCPPRPLELGEDVPMTGLRIDTRGEGRGPENL